MKKISIFITCLILAACNATETDNTNSAPTNANIPIQYIDLTDTEDLSVTSNDYWEVKRRVDPRYPVSAARDGLAGCVELIVGINSDGKMAEYKIVNSFPNGIFDNEAALAMSKWRWTPTELNSEKKPVLTKIQLDFLVEGTRNGEEAKEACGFNYKTSWLASL